MTGRIPVSWNLHGEVNAHKFSLSGAGRADLENGSTELVLTIDPAFPTGFDPKLSHMICNFALAGYAAVPQVPVSIRDAVEAKMFVRPRRQIIITDTAGDHVVRLEALTTLDVTADGIAVTNYLTGFSHLPAPVTQTIGEESLIPGRGGTATGVANYTVELDNGMTLDGLTVVPYQFDRDVRITPARRSVADQVCEWLAADTVRLRAVSRWEALAVTPQTSGA